MTVAEHVLLTARLNGLARYVVERNYADPNLRPGAKDRSLARIFERTGKEQAAEEYYLRGLQPGEVDGYLFLGQFYERQRKTEAAIRTYENALKLAEDEPELIKTLNKRMEGLRR